MRAVALIALASVLTIAWLDFSWADRVGLYALSVSLFVGGFIALHHRYSGALLAAVSIRAALAVVHAFFTALPDSQFDAVAFEANGWHIGRGTLQAVLDNFVSGSQLYSWFIGLVYWAIGGRSPLVIQALNVIGGTLVVAIASATARRLWGEEPGRRAAWLLAIFPTAALYSALTMREVAFVLPLCVGMLSFVRWMQQGGSSRYVVALLLLAVAAGFHTGGLAALAVVALAGIAARTNGRFSAPAQAVRAGLVLVAATAILSSGWGLDKLAQEDPISAHAISRAQEQRAHSRAAYLEDLTPSTAFDLLWQAPIRVVYFLFAPFPWMVRSSIDLAGIADASLYLTLLLLVMLKRRAVWLHRESRWLLAIAASLTLAFSLGTSNYGTAMRHRAKIAPMLVILALAPGFRLRVRSSDQPSRRPAKLQPVIFTDRARVAEA